MMRHSDFNDNTPTYCLALLLVIASFAVYARILGHDFITIWDDNFYVTANPHAWGFSWNNIRGAFTSFYTGNYAPVQILSYMLDFTIWEMNPAGYLLTNIVIHTVNGLLLFRLLLLWSTDRVIAFFAAALFLIHPLQVETVAWVSQRKSLLAVMFLFVSWECYCRYRQREPGRGRLFYCASLVAYFCSLLAKSVTVVFPIVLLLHDAASRSAEKRLRLRDKLPFLLAAVLIAVVTFLAQRPEVGNGGRTEYHGGSPWVTFISMLPVFCRYLGMVLWPASLSAHYGLPVHPAIDWAVVGAALLLAVTGVCGVLLWRKERTLGFWFCFYWLALLPVSQVVPLVTMMNDRYLYLPMVGLAVLAGHGLRRLLNFGSGRFTLLASVGAAVLLSALAVTSFTRAAVWSDSITLFRDVVNRYPESDYGWRLLADATQNTGRIVEARRIYEQALAHNPDNQTVLVALGKLLTSMNKLDEADHQLRRLLKINPRHAAGWAALGENLVKKKEYAEAEKAYRRALEIQGDAVPVYLLLGDLAMLQGRFDEALGYLDKVEAQSPGSPEAAYRRACLEARAGSGAQALDWLEKAIQRGYRDFDAIYDNRELEPLWNDPRFTMILDHYFPGKVPR